MLLSAHFNIILLKMRRQISPCIWYLWILSVQFSLVAQLCPTLCNPMNRSTTGLPVHHHLLEFTQTHVHQVSDAIQPSHPLSSPSPPAPNPSQHQSLFQSILWEPTNYPEISLYEITLDRKLQLREWVLLPFE